MTKTLPTLKTSRLVLRPFTLADALDVQRLAGDRHVASTTLRIPHPYQDGIAEEWIGMHTDKFAKDEGISLAVTLLDVRTLIGAVGLEICKAHARAELGCWIGKPYWGKGFASEEAKALVDYGFKVAGLNRIYAHHLVRNPASGRVMLKIGMRHEGTLRQHTKKWAEGIYVRFEKDDQLVARAKYRNQGFQSGWHDGLPKRNQLASDVR